jgi:hypothetical protein
MKKMINSARTWASSTSAKVGTGVATLMASGAAFASGGSSSPGAAIAGELAGGKGEVGLVVAACAVLIGLILLWNYTRRAAK